MSGFTDVLGGRSGSYQKEYLRAKEFALHELKKEADKRHANAVVGIKLDFEAVSSKSTSFIMVTATGTAVIAEDLQQNNS